MSGPSAEKDAPAVRVEWAHVLDEAGSACVYDTEEEVRSALALMGGGIERVESTTIVPFSVLPPAEKGQADA